MPTKKFAYLLGELSFPDCLFLAEIPPPTPPPIAAAMITRATTRTMKKVLRAKPHICCLPPAIFFGDWALCNLGRFVQILQNVNKASGRVRYGCQSIRGWR